MQSDLTVARLLIPPLFCPSLNEYIESSVQCKKNVTIVAVQILLGLKLVLLESAAQIYCLEQARFIMPASQFRVGYWGRTKLGGILGSDQINSCVCNYLCQMPRCFRVLEPPFCPANGLCN